MRISVVDCGTNTFNLLIIEVLENRNYKKLFSTRIPVKLGEGAINQGYIAQSAYKRGIEALSVFSEKFREYKVDQVLAFATSAVRDARNGAEFVEEVRARFGFGITVIDGGREAELIYYGIREAVALGSEVSLIMDIGGGSNEFLLANKDTIFWKQSFNIGAARILEKFKHSNPITAEEKKGIEDYLVAQLQPLVEAARRHNPVELIGSSGAFESLIEMVHGELGGEPLTAEKKEYELNLNQHAKVSELVRRSTIEERRRIKGLLPMRFDMIVISCIMVDLVLDLLQLGKMRVSTYSLKEGALMQHLDELQNKTN